MYFYSTEKEAIQQATLVKSSAEIQVFIENQESLGIQKDLADPSQFKQIPVLHCKNEAVAIPLQQQVVRRIISATFLCALACGTALASLLAQRQLYSKTDTSS